MMNRRVLLLSGSLISLGISLVSFVFFTGLVLNVGFVGTNLQKSTVKEVSSFQHRKLLHRGSPIDQPDRIRGERCTNDDILINQGPGTSLPSGIPTYTVEIMNACVTGCDISHIHLNCGWFSLAQLINPKIFKRIRYNDCLVNDGKPLANGGTLSFQYANSYPYVFSVSSVVCS